MKSQRISVSGRNLQFLQQLSQDMDESSLTEVLHYLLTDIRLLNYQIGNKPAPVPQTVPIGFDSSTFEPFQPAFVPNIDGDHNERNHIEIDPTIQRLLDSGLELDF
jgi:hypothetical protein